MTLEDCSLSMSRFARCSTCGKWCYPTRKAARRAARAFHPGHPMRAYQCGDWWHYGHKPAWLIRGEVS